MPLLGPVRARGSTPLQLSMDIEAELRSKYFKDPKVSVEVEAYRPFFILGEVNKPDGCPYINGNVAIAEG
jgi:polysaccharide export outer membrane protein